MLQTKTPHINLRRCRREFRLNQTLRRSHNFYQCEELLPLHLRLHFPTNRTNQQAGRRMLQREQELRFCFYRKKLMRRRNGKEVRKNSRRFQIVRSLTNRGY